MHARRTVVYILSGNRTFVYLINASKIYASRIIVYTTMLNSHMCERSLCDLFYLVRHSKDTVHIFAAEHSFVLFTNLEKSVIKLMQEGDLEYTIQYELV